MADQMNVNDNSSNKSGPTVSQFGIVGNVPKPKEEAGAQKVIGGWNPIEDLNDSHVKEIANFAVAEHSKKLGAPLKLDRVIKGETQEVAGTNYKLTLAAKEGGGSKEYEAIVYEKLPCYNSMKKLTSFEPAH